NNWEDAKLLSYLPNGKSNIVISPEYGYMDVDYIKIPSDTITLLPALSPINGVFYKDNPVGLNVFIDAKGAELQSVRSNNLNINFNILPFPHIEKAYSVSLSQLSINELLEGKHKLFFNFSTGAVAEYNLQVFNRFVAPNLTIIMFNIEHGNSTLFIFPDGKIMLIDSGKDQYARSVVIPFLEKHGIDKIDYFILTHYHDDHIGAKDDIIKEFNIETVWDYRSFKRGDSIQLNDVKFLFLNAYDNGDNENDRSLSFIMNYNGFVYSHGADNYAHTQNELMKIFKSRLQAHVFNANHHFHGSVNPNYIAITNPYLVFVSAEQAIYARGAYMDMYKERTEKVLLQRHARLIETLFSLEAGTVVIRVNDSNQWWYENYFNADDIWIGNIKQ
ncbi:MAG: MBL fold metallo-hydrolase, partial [Bacteroidales bacterium]|nr:MBL fold metallo-hydrolase [Bacteroidales bacterium]